MEKNGKRSRYYVSQALIRSQPIEAGAVALVPAQEVEKPIIDQVRALEKIKS